jgi:hypothetical protein
VPPRLLARADELSKCDRERILLHMLTPVLASIGSPVNGSMASEADQSLLRIGDRLEAPSRLSQPLLHGVVLHP